MSAPAPEDANAEAVTSADVAPLMTEEVSWALSVYRTGPDGKQTHHRSTGKAPLHAIAAAHTRLGEFGTIDDGPGSAPTDKPQSDGPSADAL